MGPEREPMPTRREVVEQFYRLPALEECISETVGEIKTYMLPCYVAGDMEERVVSWLWERIRDTAADAIVDQDTEEATIEAIMEYLLPPYVDESTRERVQTWLRTKIQNTVGLLQSAVT